MDYFFFVLKAHDTRASFIFKGYIVKKGTYTSSFIQRNNNQKGPSISEPMAGEGSTARS